jgi:hypothetical protein
MSAGRFVWRLEVLKRKVTNLLAGRAGLRGKQLLSPTWTLIHLPPQAAVSGCKRLLSLITFFAAAKKVIPPPGRRLLNKKQAKKKQNRQREANRNTHEQRVKMPTPGSKTGIPGVAEIPKNAYFTLSSAWRTVPKIRSISSSSTISGGENARISPV